jgi:hypothetical protein
MVHRQPWTATIWDYLTEFSVQLAVTGGSGAIAKTTVAPLERVKVRIDCYRRPNSMVTLTSGSYC